MSDSYIRDLGDGLVLRRATPADVDALAQFDGTIHRPNDTAPVNAAIVALVHDMAVRPHPTMTAGDFTLVEDSRTKRIVSSLCLINQTWSYAGIPFGVGRPELVGTDPEYRNRGLVRAQFEEIHRWSAERGHLLQGITGIPYYYRQFGYEYALPLGGGRTGAVFDIPILKEGAAEPYKVRKAYSDDIPFLCATYTAASRRSLVSCVRDELAWQYDLEGRSPKSDCCMSIQMIETVDNKPVGYICHAPHVRDGGLAVDKLELTENASWVDISPSVMRYLKHFGESDVAAGGQGAFNYLGFWLGAEHPLYAVLDKRLPRILPAYAWYIRVPNLRAFLTQITPVLEERLASSLAPNHSGELKLSFYRTGLILKFSQGKLTMDDWRPSPREWGDARFPNSTFLQLLFGFRSLDELQGAFPDCRGGSSEVNLILSALFPKLNSTVWGLE